MESMACFIAPRTNNQSASEPIFLSIGKIISDCYTRGMSRGTLPLYDERVLRRRPVSLHCYGAGSEGISGSPFLLFLGTAMSITAVSVLARILQEREMQSTALGMLALMCAAMTDVCAWLLLAVALTMSIRKRRDACFAEAAVACGLSRGDVMWLSLLR